MEGCGGPISLLLAEEVHAGRMLPIYTIPFIDHLSNCSLLMFKD